ncbi:MAG TPA: bifunctional oligoribonuclease/PAP phosphatase NrnA [Thermoanaerobaculia bacterium]|jgi:phosphoesterase RecJ-like protein|nr:bifunctional oligoribonuclease/PAP phosphatase NrnA [Thermoanaerobaculia bacterium]
MTTTSKTTNKTAPESLLAIVRQGNRFLLTSHLSPDGDAVGSELGLARVLRKLGKGAVVWNRDPTPPLYGPLPGSARIHVGEEPPAGFPEAFNAVLVLECPSLDRTGLQEKLAASGLPIVNVDHHLGNQQYGQVNWVDTAAPALGEMIHRFAAALKVGMDEDTATCLYLALVTDTGDFRFANTTAEAFEAAAALVREGAKPETVSQWLHESRPEPSLRLLGSMLQTLERHDGGRIATAVLTREMFTRAGAGAGDSEGLVDYPRSIAGVHAVAILREVEDGKYKVSLRSRGDVDVEQVARRHGGGGHKNAAGFTSDAALPELRERLVGELGSALPVESEETVGDPA